MLVASSKMADVAGVRLRMLPVAYAEKVGWSVFVYLRTLWNDRDHLYMYQPMAVHGVRATRRSVKL